MERMKILSNKEYDRLIIEIETLKEIRENDEMCINMMADRINRLEQLEEENKKLNEEIQRFKDNAMQDMREITELEIENKKLKEELEKWKKDYREGNIVDARNG